MISFRSISVLIALWVSIASVGAQSQHDKVLPNCPMHIIIALDFSASERAFLDEVQTVLLAITSRFELHPNTLRIGVISF